MKDGRVVAINKYVKVCVCFSETIGTATSCPSLGKGFSACLIGKLCTVCYSPNCDSIGIVALTDLIDAVNMALEPPSPSIRRDFDASVRPLSVKQVHSANIN